MTEIRGQQRESHVWVLAVSIRVQKVADSEPMAYVVKPRSACSGMRVQASAAHDGTERLLHITDQQPRARSRDQQRGCPRGRAGPVISVHILIDGGNSDRV